MAFNKCGRLVRLMYDPRGAIKFWLILVAFKFPIAAHTSYSSNHAGQYRKRRTRSMTKRATG